MARYTQRMARVSVQLSPEVLAELKQEARRGRLSISKAAQQVIERGLAIVRRAEQERALREGYLALAEDDRVLAGEMSAVSDWSS